MPYRDTWATCQKCGRRFVFTVEEQRRLTKLGFDVSIPSLCPQCEKAAELGPGLHRGVVKWYDPDKGYGFIVQRSGNELFFHRTGIAVEGDERLRLKDGVPVTYRVKVTDRGPQAVEVVPVNMEEEAK